MFAAERDVMAWDAAAWFGDPMDASPVFVREFRSRMRRPWAFWLLFAYPAILIPPSLFFFYRFRVTTLPFPSSELEALQQAHVTAMIFVLALFAVQFLLVTLLVPALTCAAFAGEQANRQLPFVLLTPLPSRRIVAGKLQCLLVYALLLLLATMPLCAIASLFGGMSPLDILTGYAALLTYALMLGAFGLYVSSRERRVAQAACWSYLGALCVPVLVPYLLVPCAGLGALLLSHDPGWLMQMTAEAPIPVLAIPLAALFGVVATWFMGETAAVLDTERHIWGTYAPPLPAEGVAEAPGESAPPLLPAALAMPVPPPVSSPRRSRRW